MKKVPVKYWEPIRMFLLDGRSGTIEIGFAQGVVESCKFYHQVGRPTAPKQEAVMPKYIEDEMTKLIEFYPRGSVRLNVHQGAVLNADFSYQKRA